MTYLSTKALTCYEITDRLGFRFPICLPAVCVEEDTVFCRSDYCRPEVETRADLISDILHLTRLHARDGNSNGNHGDTAAKEAYMGTYRRYCNAFSCLLSLQAILESDEAPVQQPRFLEGEGMEEWGLREVATWIKNGCWPLLPNPPIRMPPVEEQLVHLRGSAHLLREAV